jgi:arsenate reductase
MTLTVFHLPTCSTCKKALKWLEANGVKATLIDIREAPPSAEILRSVQERAEVASQKLFNASGQVYRGGGWKEQLPELSDGERFAALASNGMLIKRPLALGATQAAVGFKEAEWAEKFGI